MAAANGYTLAVPSVSNVLTRAATPSVAQGLISKASGIGNDVRMLSMALPSDCTQSTLFKQPVPDRDTQDHHASSAVPIRVSRYRDTTRYSFRAGTRPP